VSALSAKRVFCQPFPVLQMMMFDSEMRFEDVIQKNLKIDVSAIRDRVVQLSKMKRICETR
jgi:hypothetical protein